MFYLDLLLISLSQVISINALIINKIHENHKKHLNTWYIDAYKK